MTDKPNLCKYCKHAKRSYFPMPFSPMMFAKCKISGNLKTIDVVTGKVTGGGLHYCSTERFACNDTRCGSEGRKFEPRKAEK